jgi:hypothetical protein
MTPEENMDAPDVFIPISEETLSELCSAELILHGWEIDNYTVSNMAKELSMLRSEVRRLRAIEAAAKGLMVPYDSRCSQRNQWVCFLPSGQRVLLTIDSVAALQAALAAKGEK